MDAVTLVSDRAWWVGSLLCIFDGLRICLRRDVLY